MEQESVRARIAAWLRRRLGTSRYERLRATALRGRETWRLLRANRMATGGLALLLAIVAMAILAPLIAIQDPADLLGSIDITAIYKPPSFEGSWEDWRPFGTDYLGRDVYSQFVWGARPSIFVGLLSAALAMALGALVGVVSGVYGRYADEALMRLTDVFLVIPWIPLAIILLAIIGGTTEDIIRMTVIIIVIGITSWPYTARIVRAEVLSLRERAFVERARAAGSGGDHIIRAHIMPNILPLVFANMILMVGIAVLSEAFLAFYGFASNQMSWGKMLREGYSEGAFLHQAWWYILPPGLGIVLLVLGFTYLGHALDEILNPRLRRR